jgi:diguanylate cyclase (GGDEF)-like protein
VEQAQITGFQQLSARWSRILGAATTASLGLAVEMCLEELGQFTGVDVAFATLVDDDERVCDDWHWIRVGRHAVAPAVGSHLRDTFASVTEIVKLGHVVAVDDIDQLELSPSERSLATANNLRAIVVVPVQISTALIGIAGLLVFDEARAWDKSIVQQMKLLSELLVRAVIRTRDRGALALADARARRISEFIPAGLLLVAMDASVNWVSPSFLRMSQAGAKELAGRCVLDITHPEDHVALSSAMTRSRVERTTVTVRLCLDAEWRWCDLSLRLASEPDSGVPDEFVVSVHDSHARQIEAEELARASRCDPLTGAANRVGLTHALTDLTARDARIIVAYCDVDDFKLVNDRDGHAAGDQLLRTISHALRSAVRPEDVVARIGGDEFAVVIHDSGAPDAAATLAKRILSSIENAARGVTVSIGVSEGASAHEASTLVRIADEALYEAKRLGKNRFVVRVFVADPPNEI